MTSVSVPLPSAPPSRLNAAARHIAPNWFTCVMGTGIVANALALLPRSLAGQEQVAAAVWLLAATLLVLIGTAAVAQWVVHPAAARRHLDDPGMAPAYGAVAMALLTVGAGALLAGHVMIGDDAALAIAWTLWIVGTVVGLAVAVIVPYMMITRHVLRLQDALGSWLMPVVSPMVSAATGAALIDHVGGHQGRLLLLVACYAMFGLSLLASLPILALLWHRLIAHGPGAVATTPTLCIVLGPLGQSITATNLLGAHAHGVVAPPLDTAMAALGVLYGLPMLGFALFWAVLVVALTARALRSGLTFNMTWWSYTFPVGTVVTGTSLLAVRLDSDAVAWLAMALFATLVLTSAAALTGTVRGALAGDLLVPGGLLGRSRA